MNDKSRPSSPSRISRYWVDWCDGFWICFCFAIAYLLSFAIPFAVLKWAAKAAGEGVPKPLSLTLNIIFLAISGPILLSRVYRELEYPGTRRQREKARAVEPQLATPEV